MIVAGVYTTVLAFTSSDGLVADDYYKQGLAINKTLKREERARALDMNVVLETGQWRLAGVWNEPLRATLALAPAAL